MIEPILKALIQLFALISDVRDISEISSRERDIVRLFLSRQLNAEMVNKYMGMFDEYIKQYTPDKIDRGSIRDMRRTSLISIKILGICEQINEELQQKQKLYVLVQLMDFILFGAVITENEIEFLETVSTAFDISATEFQNIKSFILNSVNEVPEKNMLMIIDGNKDNKFIGSKHLFRENLKGSILILHIESINIYILKYSGNEDLFLNGQNLFPGQTYTFDHGSTIRGSVLSTIYYNDVSSVFTEATFKLKISLEAVNVSLRFKNSEYGIQKFDFYEESGNLVGILGGSGVGKTTLLNILSGIAKPQTGEVLINGYNIYSEEEIIYLKGVIGFVPQDDLLIEELTVWQNLFFSAKMCLDNLSEDKLKDVVNKTLGELDLDEIRDLKVGNSLNKVISGGQRKRLNIALELIREPTILFVDEPTSGLSSVDSEIVMNLLKEQTDRGKLVIINIHQPGSDLYKMFDKIMIIDKGGYLIFYGNPSEAIVYFKTKASYANANEDQCITCGNVNSDQLLQIIEAKVINERGKHTHIRKVAPKDWAEMFLLNNEKAKLKNYDDKRPLPENFYSIPGLIKQAKIFLVRDILSKLGNMQSFVTSILVAPLLALLLAYFIKYNATDEYIFRDNDNLPAYLFMCVITSLFIGLIISAEEIVKDRKILKRESFLNLSWFSYLNSKIIIMFLISAIQALTFVLIGNLILEVKGMALSYWLIAFSTSCMANMIGLNISSAFNSLITIYSLIPLIIIPQLLFSGVFVKFDKLHQGIFTSSEFVPVIGEMMPARWSFEALAVEQFKNNKFEKNFFKFDMEISQNDWYSAFLINRLKADLNECRIRNDSLNYRQTINDNFYKLNLYIDKLTLLAGFDSIRGTWKKSLNAESFNPGVAKEAGKYLDSLSRHFRKIQNRFRDQRDSVYNSVEARTGTEGLMRLKDNYSNKQLELYVLDLLRVDKSIEIRKKIIQKYEPVFMKPTSKFGRAQFYAPYKQVGNIKIDTYWFNLIVIWMATLVLYIVLYYKLLQKLVDSPGKIILKEVRR